MGGLTIENNFFILKIEKRNKIIVFDFQKVGAGAQKSGGAAALPAPPLPRSLKDCAGTSANYIETKHHSDCINGLIGALNCQVAPLTQKGKQ